MFKIWWSDKKRTQKLKILNWGTGEHRVSFYRNNWTGTHWDWCLNIFLYAKILWAQNIAINRIWCNYFDMIRHVTSSYKTVLLFIDSKLKAVIRAKVHLG